ncbi:NLRC3, partial [Symbiodinium sp. KB8]
MADPSKPTSTARGMLPGIPHYVDRVSAECIWKETLEKETRLFQEGRKANPGPPAYVMNLANAQRLGDPLALKIRHSRLEILAPKVEKNTPQAIMSGENCDPNSFDHNALMHTKKMPCQKWDVPCTRAQEIGWLIATRSSAQAVEAMKVRKRYPEAEALGICPPPRSESMPSLECRRRLPEAPPDKRLKQLNNNRFYRPKTFCDITLYADNYMATMHHDPFSRAGAGLNRFASANHTGLPSWFQLPSQRRLLFMPFSSGTLDLVSLQSSGFALIHICQRPSQVQYGLTDRKSLAEYLNHANIRLVRAEYLYELLKSKNLLPRRQEADPEEWGLVTHAEVKAWAAGTRDAMICSVSHAWESREHPDPCAHQLKCLVDVVSLFDAAYFSDIWLFYDYVSLFQFKRESDAEEESFRRSMQAMHVLYAHECTRTFRIENLTPDDVWEEAKHNSEYRVRVYDARSGVVRDRPLKELVANRVLYGTRGWCKAEVEWSSARSHSEQNHWIDAPESQQRNEEESEGEQEPELLGKVPMAPEIFEKEMDSAAFTHRSDAEEVKKLQFKVFLQKVSECEEALFERLPEGQLRRLAKALPYFKKLRVLRLRAFRVGRADAEEFAKALAPNEAIRELEIAICEVLKTNSALTSINLE